MTTDRSVPKRDGIECRPAARSKCSSCRLYSTSNPPTHVSTAIISAMMAASGAAPIAIHAPPGASASDSPSTRCAAHVNRLHSE